MTMPAPQFSGRTELFTWMQQKVSLAEPPSVLLLTGPAQIGKTAVLDQLHLGRLGPDNVPIYVDLAQLSQHTASAFFWELAQTAVADFNQKRHLPIPLEQSGFVANPLPALTDQFIQPLLAWLDSRRLLLLLDNFQALKMNGDGAENELLNSILTWLRQQTAVTSILTLTLETAKLTPYWEEVLAGSDQFFIEPLQLDEVVDLLQQSQSVLMVEAVIQKVYETTGGKPQTIQALCRFFQTRLAKGRLHQITLADLAMAHKMGVGRS